RNDVAMADSSGLLVPLGTPGAHPVLDTPYGGGPRGTMRPSVAAGVNPYWNDRLLVLNPDAFTLPQIGQYGNLGRNALVGPGFSQADFQITRTFPLGETRALDFRADVYNLLNHTNFAPPTAMLINVAPLVQPGGAFNMSQAANFGIISSTIGRNLGLGTSRQIQLGLRLTF
ncbi:MAG: hypothetical protein M1541_02710, partial [Acidobacteria bacterium]|nr:hypothetical protein [Acidobacteriota bacterium]